ncbi:MAG: LD-carboxypeptidase [Bacteroidales bacterium]|nr:LD-carboxypeptidase [Bacteroidales bacterium]
MQNLSKGGRIAIVAPSGTICDEYLTSAVELIRSEGYEVEIMPHVSGCSTGVFSATDAERAADLKEAVERKDIDAIICSRGGYGAVRTIQAMGIETFRNCNKWIVGFSDITAIHSSMSRFGHLSLHAPMLKHIAIHGMHAPDIEMLFSILRGEKPQLTVQNNPSLSRAGQAEGILTGGNLSLIYSLRNTPADIESRGRILFIEDLSEYNYHIDRMMQNLKFSGILENLSGLIVGQFTGMKDGATAFGKDAYEIIADAVSDYDYPVLMGFPAGHAQEINMPLIMGAKASLNVGSESSVLTYL